MARALKMPAAAAPDAAAGADPDAGADAGDDTTGATDAGDDDTGDTVLVTIAQGADGGYVVYAGDEPDDGDGASADDDAAAGGAGAGAAGAAAGGESGQHVDSIGAALKAALDILNESASSAGAAGSSDDQFAAGYGGDQSPTPAAARGARGLKYPPAAAT